MSHKCETFDCDNQIFMDDCRFCGSCNASVIRDVKELERELDRHMGLAAEFDAWCIAHGLPDPHD